MWIMKREVSQRSFPEYNRCSAVWNLKAATTSPGRCQSRLYHIIPILFHHITRILKSLHWFKINEKIKYKVLSLTYKSLKTSYRSLLSFPSHRCTRSSSLISLSRPSLTFRLKIANRSYYHSAPILWNNLPFHLRQIVHHITPSSI